MFSGEEAAVKYMNPAYAKRSVAAMTEKAIAKFMRLCASVTKSHN